MPWSHDPIVQTLRLKYNAAMAAHQPLAAAIAEASIGGSVPSADLVEREARAHVRLVQAREELYAAMAALVTGQHPILTLAPGDRTET